MNLPFIPFQYTIVRTTEGAVLGTERPTLHLATSLLRSIGKSGNYIIPRANKLGRSVPNPQVLGSKIRVVGFFFLFFFVLFSPSPCPPELLSATNPARYVVEAPLALSVHETNGGDDQRGLRRVLTGEGGALLFGFGGSTRPRHAVNDGAVSEV